MRLGIDPGLRNIGMALLNEEGCVVRTSHHDLLDMSIFESAEVIREFAGEDLPEVKEAFMERFVAYQGKLNASSEQILMIMGGVEYMLASSGISTFKCRAIDWKPLLCKWAVKEYGFSNPSTSFDKKFDLALATTITGHTFRTDHEADAACLASLFRTRTPARKT